MPTSRSRSIYVFCLAAVWSTCILLIEAACPSGWTTGSSANRCHKVFSQTSQFDDVNAARDVCRQKGADLATIINSTEETIIAGIIKGLDNSVTDVYIGAIATVDPSLYSWLDNETAFIYQASSEPYNASDIRHVADRCVTLCSEDGSWINTVWRRIPCCFRSNITAVACTKPSDDNLLASDNTVVDFCFGACPSGSFRLNDKCYKIKQESQSFNSIYFAQLSCNQDGYRLADSIPDIVFDHVVSILKQMAVPTGVVVYTGLNNLTSANTFVTVDGSSYSEASLLAIDKCSYNSSNDKCITLMTRSSTWDVFSTIYCPRQCCSDLGITYVACEKPITSEINQDDNDVFGMTCYGDIDECNSNPCSNVATCQNKILKYNCLCPEGYTGVGCETVIDNCESDPCQNGQNCTTYIGHYVCECEPGYEGVNCETDIDECANITCLHGGTCVDKVNSAVCDCPGQFTGNFCETLILCQSFDQDVANGTVKMSGTNEAGDQIDIVCEDGLLLKDRSPNKTLTCLSSTGEWDYPLDQLGNCANHCSALPEVANVQVENPTTEYGSEVSYVCETGYQFPDNTTRANMTCLDNGKWTRESIPDCEIIKCSPLPDWPFQTKDSSNHTYNSTVTFWCDIGYELVDRTTSRTIHCLENGEWSAPLPECHPVVCPDIELPSSWSISRDTDEHIYGTYTTYRCDDEKRMIDGATFREILCDATGNWSDNITDCKKERCFPLPLVANATPSTLVAEYGTTTILTCIAGHRFSGKYKTRKMICITDGWWRPILEACNPILCPVLTDVLNTERSTDNRLYDTVVGYKCIKGHYYYPNMTSLVSIRCLDSEQWNDTNLEPCWPIVCGSPPTITNGTITLPPNNNFNYSALVSYQCITGFKFIDGKIARTIQCNEFGEWNHSDVSCRVDRCSPVPIANNVVPDTTNTSWYTNVTYQCQRGYEWPNNKSVHHITCQNNGQWNDTNIPSCTIKKCSPVELMHNATINTTDHVYDTYVNYECDKGFKFPDNETVKTKWCSDWAFWEPGEFPECEITYCPALEDVENATRDTNDTYYNKHVIYSCLPGYQFPDKSKMWTVYCTENETWSGTPEPCEVVFCPPVPWWTETVFNSTLNEFNAEISYWCSEGYVFEDSFNKPDTIKTATCSHAKVWEPSIDDCLAKESIDAALRGVTYESPAGVSIGTIACSLTVTVLCCIVLLDTKKIYSDLKVMKRNVSSFVEEMKTKRGRSNRVSDSQLNIKSNSDSP